MEEPATWTLGGGQILPPDDGIDYDPNIIDVILDGEGQTTMLSSYDVAGHTYAQLTGFEMPEVPNKSSEHRWTPSPPRRPCSRGHTVAETTSVEVVLAGEQPTGTDAAAPPPQRRPTMLSPYRTDGQHQLHGVHFSQ